VLPYIEDNVIYDIILEPLRENPLQSKEIIYVIQDIHNPRSISNNPITVILSRYILIKK
jgi:hypothetical protein